MEASEQEIPNHDMSISTNKFHISGNSQACACLQQERYNAHLLSGEEQLQRRRRPGPRQG